MRYANILDMPLPISFPKVVSYKGKRYTWLWGAGCSPGQVESGWNNWDAWLQHRAPLQATHILTRGRACRFESRYRSDMRMARAQNHSALRFGIDRTKTEPSPGVYDEKELDRYKDMVDFALSIGLTPVVNLEWWTCSEKCDAAHWWLRPDYPDLLEAYVEKLLQKLGKSVKYFTVFNEPNVFTKLVFSENEGEWLGRKQRSAANLETVTANFVEGHKRAHPKSLVGIAQSTNWRSADDPATKMREDMWDYDFLDKIKDHLDFVGINPYMHTHYFADGDMIRGWWGLDPCIRAKGRRPTEPCNDMCPRVIYEVATAIFKRYQLPILITEHGQNDPHLEDGRRISFMAESFKWLHKAIREGVPVIGYFVWTIMDCFEWGNGYTDCFGLWHVDRDTLERTPRTSAEFYANVIAARGLTPAIYEKYKKYIAPIMCIPVNS